MFQGKKMYGRNLLYSRLHNSNLGRKIQEKTHGNKSVVHTFTFDEKTNIWSVDINKISGGQCHHIYVDNLLIKK